MSCEKILSAILDCGEVDVSLLNDIEYDIFDIVNITKDRYGEITLEYLINVVVEKGINDFDEAVADRISNIKLDYSNLNEIVGDRTPDEYEDYMCDLDDNGLLSWEDFKDMNEVLLHYRELEALEQLNVKEDIEYSFNYLATYVHFINNEELYQDYCGDMITEFENHTGFPL